MRMAIRVHRHALRASSRFAENRTPPRFLRVRAQPSDSSSSARRSSVPRAQVAKSWNRRAMAQAEHRPRGLDRKRETMRGLGEELDVGAGGELVGAAGAFIFRGELTTKWVPIMNERFVIGIAPGIGAAKTSPLRHSNRLRSHLKSAVERVPTRRTTDFTDAHGPLRRPRPLPGIGRKLRAVPEWNSERRRVVESVPERSGNSARARSWFQTGMEPGEAARSGSTPEPSDRRSQLVPDWNQGGSRASAAATLTSRQRRASPRPGESAPRAASPRPPAPPPHPAPSARSSAPRGCTQSASSAAASRWIPASSR